MFAFAYLLPICIAMKYKPKRKKENESLMGWVNNDLGFKQQYEKTMLSFIWSPFEIGPQVDAT